MSRTRNLIQGIEDIPEELLCPKCKSPDIGRPTPSKTQGKYQLDVFSDLWLECKECWAIWRKNRKEKLDEDRE